MQSILPFFVVIPDLEKNADLTLLRGQLSSLKRQLSAAFWVCVLGRTFQSWRVCETCLKNCLRLLMYLSFISPLRTVWAMSVNTNRILDSWRLENSTWSRLCTKDRFAFSSSEFTNVDHSWRISILCPFFVKVHLQLKNIKKNWQI